MIRYPGSKDKIVAAIVAAFPDSCRMALFHDPRLEYREPFFGAGAVGFRVFRALSPQNRIWINDRDYGVRCLWGAVYDVPDELIRRVRAFVPSVEAFDRFKAEDSRRDLDIPETGFRKLALHQLSFSGLGVKSGGPLGGRRQSSQYNVDCRWNASRLCRDIQQKHRHLRAFAQVRITARDSLALIDGAPAHAFIYADPPYVAKGPDLYKHSMAEEDHRRLAAALFACRAPWVVSYDDHPLVRELYAGARIQSVAVTYTTAQVRTELRRKNAEVIISREAH